MVFLLLALSGRAVLGDPPRLVVAPLPGALPATPDLVRQLEVRWERRQPGYTPRTRPLNANRTSNKYTNRLFLTSSPYLLQHSHNPGNWYPWGDEAFETARKLGHPVLLSVGYSTCYWCHVMGEESFEDEEIARYVNENYIAIKVDREERPDVEAIYMSAVQMLTGGGGPMTVWLTPDRKPFYGGTYFPARDGDRGSAVGFLTILKKIRQTYAERPDDVVKSSTALVERIWQSLAPQTSDAGFPGADVLHAAARQYASRFDAENGGTPGAQDFLSSLPVRFLRQYDRHAGNAPARNMATKTAEHMAAGGIYDQVGGGFHRSSTDARWLVPHFEKMLYDNALLIIAHLEGYQVTGRDDFARVARETLRDVECDMTSPEGGFYSATDADRLARNGHREEGWFFTGTPAEIGATIGAEHAGPIETYFAVSNGGNFECRNILHASRPLATVAAELKLPADRLRTLLDESRESLYQARAKRSPSAS